MGEATKAEGCDGNRKKLCELEECEWCYNRSFASHPKSQFWSEDNKDTPRQIFMNSGYKRWFKCHNKTCNHLFSSMIYHISDRKNSTWCPYCCDPPLKLCKNKKCMSCHSRSFASHPKSKFWHHSNRDSPRDLMRYSSYKRLFICDNKQCNHTFESMISNITNKIKMKWCPYCSNRKLCKDENCTLCHSKSFASHPKSSFWLEHNRDTPRDIFMNCAKKRWFRCDKESNHIFESMISNITTKNKPKWCPWCRNKTEDKLYNWLISNNFEVKRQAKFHWCRSHLSDRYLPFDFLVNDSIIIELDGLQHFQQVWNWKHPSLNFITDRFKEKRAKENGYSIIRLLQEEVYDDATSIDSNGNLVTWMDLLLASLSDPRPNGPDVTLLTSMGQWPNIPEAEGIYTIKFEYYTSISKSLRLN